MINQSLSFYLEKLTGLDQFICEYKPSWLVYFNIKTMQELSMTEFQDVENNLAFSSFPAMT